MEDHDKTKTQLIDELNLMAISALLLIEKRYTPVEEGRPSVMAVLNRLDRRIRGLIETHTLLSQTQWSPVLLTELVERVGRGLLQHLPLQKQINLDVSSPPVTISPRQASNLALIINELVTNTAKYALNTPAKAVNIKIQVQSVPEDATIMLEYRDDGPGYPPEILAAQADATGSDEAISRAGLHLIERLAAHALKGTVMLANDHGAVTKIQFYAEDEQTT